MVSRNVMNMIPKMQKFFMGQPVKKTCVMCLFMATTR